jgi:hypothetical protein
LAANLSLADVFFPANQKPTNCMRPNAGQALQLALFFTQASAAPIENPGLPFEIYIDQEAFIPPTPGR